MQRFTNIKVIAVFAVTFIVIFIAYRLTSISLKELVQTVRTASQPDMVLIKVKEINADIIEAESGIRAFTLTRDVKYLDPYQTLAATIDKKLDTLRQLTEEKNYHAASVDSIAVLMKKKLAVYDQLLGLSYTTVLESALGKITSNIPKKDTIIEDTTSITTNNQPKKGFFKKIFSSSGPSKKELQEKAIAAKKESADRITEIQSVVSEIEQKESKQLRTQTALELVLLNKDKDLTLQITGLIRKLETDAYYNSWQKTENANKHAEKSSTFIMVLMFSGALLILLLITLIIYDITKSDLYRKKLADEKSRAEKLAKIKEDFLANMSHEIRTPLTAILGYSERLQKEKLDEKQNLYVKAINTSAGHLLSIVNDILDLTKIETGHLRFEKINFIPSQIISEVCEALKLKADEKNLVLDYSIDKIKNTVLLGDPLRLKQVLFNILGNAIKFTGQGSVTVKPKLIPQNNFPNRIANLKIEIMDTGIGIPQEKISELFTEFAQADSSISRKFGGSGLGLSISKRIVEYQDGNIEVKSEEDKGSTFIITIPYEVVEIKAPILEKKITSSANSNLSGMKILLAEDVEINRELQTQILKEAGAIVDSAVDGREAIEKLKRNSYDFVLMDVQMPGTSGIEAIREIRNVMHLPIPVIALTANVMQDDIDRYLREGFNGYITKPFKEVELIEKILQVNKVSPLVIKEYNNGLEKVNEKAYDLADLTKASNGNNDFMIKMTALFISNCEDTLQIMEKLIERKDFAAAGATAHKLIPSCRHFCIYDGAEQLKKIEINASSNNVKEIKRNFADAKSILENVVSELKKDLEKFEKNLV